MPTRSRDAQVEACVPGRGPRVVFSALDASRRTRSSRRSPPPATSWSATPATSGWIRCVPLLIPEINAEHLALLREQRQGADGAAPSSPIPNCSTIVLAMALAPLRQFGIDRSFVSTMQAVSGAGYPGVPSLDILGNVVPFIGGEEEKIEKRDAEDPRHRRRPHRRHGR